MKILIAAFVGAATVASVHGCGSEFIDLENTRLGQATRHGRELSSGSSWEYENDGASHWKENFEGCGETEQSPIDIPSAFIRSKKIQSDGALPVLSPSYSLVTGTLKNNNHTVQVDLSGQTLGSNSLTKTISRSTSAHAYTLAQFHFHWADTDASGSEHTVDGDAFPLEVHFVHYNNKYPSLSKAANETDGLLVIGVLFQISNAENPGVANLTEALKSLQVDSIAVDINPSGFFDGIDLSKYFLYAGSLTTPGCYQSVTWVVMEQRVPITLEQLKAFRDVPHIESHNYRPVQPLNSRTVFNRNFKVTGLDINPTAHPTSSPTEPATAPTGAPTMDVEDDSNTFKITTGIFAGTTVLLSIALTGLLVSRSKTHPSGGKMDDNQV